MKLVRSHESSSNGISSVREIIADIKAGKMVVLVDEEDRENEGDLVMAAEFVTPAAINFMTKHARGLICLTLTDERCQQLNLLPMASDNRSPMGTNFTVSIEAAKGVTTGISAADRARTVQAAVAPDAKPGDIIQPGHIFPIKAQKGGVLVRAGHTEAGCDLAQLAGLTPASVICEILKDDGEMARLPDLIEYAKQHQLKIGTIADLIHYRSETEKLVERVAEKNIQTRYGAFKLVAYHDKTANETHLALVKGDPRPDTETLVRVHEPLNVMDLLDETDDMHSFGLHPAMRIVAEAQTGVIVLLRRAQTPQDIVRRILPRQQKHSGEVKWDSRIYGIGAQILRDLNVGKMRLLAKPQKMPSLAGFDLEVTGYFSSDKKN
ncbi:MAG: bifunctional 3,4-dihydroxy-2-butanone-4-phosphate synthase/GTP cyclohydrolase II [Burkholderiales bacterium]